MSSEIKGSKDPWFNLPAFDEVLKLEEVRPKPADELRLKEMGPLKESFEQLSADEQRLKVVVAGIDIGTSILDGTDFDSVNSTVLPLFLAWCAAWPCCGRDSKPVSISVLLLKSVGESRP